MEKLLKKRSIIRYDKRKVIQQIVNLEAFFQKVKSYQKLNLINVLIEENVKISLNLIQINYN